MTAEQYAQHRIAEIDGMLRLHRYYELDLPQLPSDLRDPAYTDLAKQAHARESADLAARGIRRLAPGEGPQPVTRRAVPK